MTASKLRRATPDDLDAVLALTELLAGPFALPPGRTHGMVAEADKAPLRDAITAPKRPDEERVMVAQDGDGALIGLAHAFAKRDFFDGSVTAHLSVLTVAERARGAGLGALLLADFEAWAREIGAARVGMNAWVGNAAARRLYARAGYAEALVSYEKPLDPSLG